MLALRKPTVLVLAHVGIEDAPEHILDVGEEFGGVLDILQLDRAIEVRGALEAADIRVPDFPGAELAFAQVIDVLEVALGEILQDDLEPRF